MQIDGSNVCFGPAGCTRWTELALYAGSLLLLLALVLGALLWDARRAAPPSQAAVRANRHATLASVVGVALMLVLLTNTVTWIVFGPLTTWGIRDGRLLALLPALAGLCLLLAQAVGQLTWPTPTGARREAELTPRTTADVVPRRVHLVLRSWAAVALVLLVLFGIAADGPRSMTREAGRYSELVGPYPGWYYGVPLAVAVVVLVAATEGVLRLVTVRPAVVGVSPAWDLRLRRRSAGHVARGVQLVLAVTVAGILTAAGVVHRSLGIDRIELASGGYAYEGAAAQHVVGTALLVLAVGALVVGISTALLPERSARPASTRPSVAAVTP